MKNFLLQRYFKNNFRSKLLNYLGAIIIYWRVLWFIVVERTYNICYEENFFEIKFIILFLRDWGSLTRTFFVYVPGKKECSRVNRKKRVNSGLAWHCYSVLEAI